MTVTVGIMVSLPINFKYQFLLFYYRWGAIKIKIIIYTQRKLIWYKLKSLVKKGKISSKCLQSTKSIPPNFDKNEMLVGFFT